MPYHDQTARLPSLKNVERTRGPVSCRAAALAVYCRLLAGPAYCPHAMRLSAGRMALCVSSGLRAGVHQCAAVAPRTAAQPCRLTAHLLQLAPLRAAFPTLRRASSRSSQAVKARFSLAIFLPNCRLARWKLPAGLPALAAMCALLASALFAESALGRSRIPCPALPACQWPPNSTTSPPWQPAAELL